MQVNNNSVSNNAIAKLPESIQEIMGKVNKFFNDNSAVIAAVFIAVQWAFLPAIGATIMAFRATILVAGVAIFYEKIKISNDHASWFVILGFAAGHFTGIAPLTGVALGFGLAHAVSKAK